MSDMPRRRFLAGAGAALAGLGINFAHAGVARADQHWDETFDVIIVGAGLAGLTAACAALDEGAKSVLLEKMSVSGGTGNYSNGTFSVVGSPQQAAGAVRSSRATLPNRVTRRTSLRSRTGRRSRTTSFPSPATA